MNERAVLKLLEKELPYAGDDAAVIDSLVITTDMLHDHTDFPEGITMYTIGWRSIAASLSDIAAMAGAPIATVAVYGAPSFEPDPIREFVRGAIDVSESVNAEYVGGDLDGHTERTIASTAVGTTDAPVYRSGAEPGDAVCVTGSLGRSASAIRLFESGDITQANQLFQFPPRVSTGEFLGNYATAMMDSSDGLARSLHQLGEASTCGFSIEQELLPIDNSVYQVADTPEDILELGVYFGEDFELLFTVPDEEFQIVEETAPVPVTKIGHVTETGITMDDDPLPDRGYTHN